MLQVEPVSILSYDSNIFERVIFSNLLFGHYLGLIISIIPAMTAKIFIENGQVQHRSMYKVLSPDEISDKDRLNAQEQNMARVFERLGS